jgi:hypothetical protein
MLIGGESIKGGIAFGETAIWRCVIFPQKEGEGSGKAE